MGCTEIIDPTLWSYPIYTATMYLANVSFRLFIVIKDQEIMRHGRYYTFGISIIIVYLTANVASYADSIFAPNRLQNWEAFVSVGPTWFHANDGYTRVSSYETDTAAIQGSDNAIFVQWGLGYHVFKSQLQQRSYFNDLLIEIDGTYTHTQFKGIVMQSGEAIFANYHFKAPLTSYWLTVAAKPSLFTYHGFSPYLIGAIGTAWSTMSYNEQVVVPDIAANSALSLVKKTNTHFIYNLGAGIRYAISPHLDISAEYLYAHFGPLSPGGISPSAINPPSIEHGPSFPVYSQVLNLGLHVHC